MPTQWNRWWDAGTRLTWQAAPKHKLALAVNNQYALQREYVFRHHLPGRRPMSPEAARRQLPSVVSDHPADWTSPITSRLLLETHVVFWKFGGGVYNLKDPAQGPDVADVMDTVTGIRYRTWGGNAPQNLGPQSEMRWRTAASYVTGTHHTLVGVQFGRNTIRLRTPTHELRFSISSATVFPTRITLRGAPVQYLDRQGRRHRPVCLGTMDGEETHADGRYPV